jgi:nucleotide-binding universal stress UspA family protein
MTATVGFGRDFPDFLQYRRPRASIAGRPRMSQGGHVMAANPIVVGTDGSAEAARAVRWAAREAVRHGAPLRIVAAAATLPRMTHRSAPGQYETVTDTLLDERDRALASAAEQAAQTDPGLLIDTDPLTGPIAEAVTAAGSGALMLVLGSRGGGAFAALLLGSVSRYAASHASCPVVVIRDEEPGPYGRVAVGVGDPDHCGGALAFAFAEASLRGAGLTAVHAWQPPASTISRAGPEAVALSPEAVSADAAGQLDALLDDCRARYPDVQVTHEVVHGHPARALIGLSARADLVVVGRRAGDRPGPGAVRHAVLNHAHGPVATVPS